MNMKYRSRKRYGHGGNIDDKKAMVLSQIKEVHHHADELAKVLAKMDTVDAWVVGKMERATTDLSDITHYLDGTSEYMANGGMMARGGEVRYKLKGNNFGDQIENGRKFKVLIERAFNNQSGETRYPLNFISETAFIGKIVKHDGKNYLKDYSYKGTLSKFDFLDDKDFIEALKYVDRPAIRKFEDGGIADNPKYILVKIVTDTDSLDDIDNESKWKNLPIQEVQYSLIDENGNKISDLKNDINSNTTVSKFVKLLNKKFGKQVDNDDIIDSMYVYEGGVPYTFLYLYEYKMADGGTTIGDYDEYNMVVITKELEKDGGHYQKWDTIVSARNIDEAKKIATKKWEDELRLSDLRLVEVISKEQYRLNRDVYMQKYKLKDGGMMARGGDLLKEDDYVWNAVGNKLVVNKVTDDEYYFDYFGSISPKPFKKEKVNEYIKTGQWTLKAPKMEDGGMMAKGGRTRSGSYTYVPKEFIDTITTSNDVEFDNKDILDGTYIKGKNRKFALGGSTQKKKPRFRVTIFSKVFEDPNNEFYNKYDTKYEYFDDYKSANKLYDSCIGVSNVIEVDLDVLKTDEFGYDHYTNIKWHHYKKHKNA